MAISEAYTGTATISTTEISLVSGTSTLQSIATSLKIRDVGRVRMLMMAPKTTYSLHHDPDLWRVHIPLITNPDAFMFVDGKMWHLAVGKAYLVKVKHHHLAVNAGNENRIHSRRISTASKSSLHCHAKSSGALPA
mgnify:CR=1 FL=1